MELIVYKDIVKDIEIINGWMNPNSLSIKNSEKEKKKLLDNIGCVELKFDIKDEEQYRIRKEKLLLNFFKLNTTLSHYVFQTEFSSAPQSKIRSYKGIVPKSINKVDYIEVEESITGNNTLIGAIVKLRCDDWNSAIVSMLSSSSCSFIISSENEDIYSKEFVSNIFQNQMVHNGISTINYVELLLSNCLRGDILYRIAGDAVNYFSLQIFFPKERLDLILMKLENSIENLSV